ncbi:IS110 family transposase [Rhizobium sp. OAE497]|uniref:IS110 family transposase n=1 Tax=Rhizobium sp. OAE497 TaxID=2663796 RepID=UPI0018F7BDD8
MNEVKVVGLDLAKNVLQAHGIDSSGKKTFNVRLKREQVKPFFAGLDPCLVAMEAGSACHFWGREIARFGHEIMIIPAQHVKPFVKRNKTDALDAQAIAVAALQDGMQRVAVKTVEQQALTVIIKTRALFIRQRTNTLLALRGHLAEFGFITGTGVARLTKITEDVCAGRIPEIPELARQAVADVLAEVEALNVRIERLEADVARLSRADGDVRRLLAIPGIGPVTASAIKAYVPDIAVFRSSRHFASWLGLTPRSHDSGGKSRPGRISKRGNVTLRSLLYLGGLTLVRIAKAKPEADPWLARLATNKPMKVAAVAAANKLARIIWALLTGSKDYTPAPVT